MPDSKCTNCGAPVAAGMPNCQNCGAPVASAPAQAPAAYGAPPAPSAPPAPPKGSPYAVVSPLGFIGYSIVMALPIIGIIMAFVWAFGSSGSLNRRNYARAMLILWLIAIVLAIVSTIMFGSLITQFANISYTF